MKYHTTLSTVVISISIALLFFLVSIFILASLNMTSPTLILTNRIFDSWQNANSDIAISFSSIERNLRDRVYVNGLTLKYKDQEVLYFDKLILERGLFSFAGYLISGSGVLSVYGENGRITIPEFASSETKSDNSFELNELLTKKFEISLPEELNSWGFKLKLDNVDISISDIKLDNLCLNLFFDHGIENFNAKINLPKFEYQKDDANVSLNEIDLSLTESGDLYLNAKVNSISGGYKDINASIENAELNTNFDLANLVLFDLPITFLFDNLEFAGFDVNVNAEKSAISLRNRNLYLDLMKDSIDYNDYKLSMDKLSLKTSDYENINLTLLNANLDQDNKELIYVQSLDSVVDIAKRNLTYNLPVVDLKLIDSLTEGLINNIKVSKISGDIDFASSLNVCANADVSIASKDELLNSSSFGLNADIDYSNKIFSYDVKLNDIHVSNIIQDVNLGIKGDEEKLSLNLKYLDSIKLEAKLDDKLDLNIDINDLNVDDLLPIVNEFIPSFKSYISDETMLSFNLKSSLEYDENAKLKFIGDFNSDLDLENIKFGESSFSLGINILGSLLNNSITFDDFLISSDFVDIDYKGLIDFTSKLPEGNFTILNNQKKQLFALDMTASDLREYTFYAQSPLIEDFYITGIVNFSTENLITSDATLNLFNRINPFDLRIELDNKILKMNNDNIDIDVNWHDILKIAINFNKLPLSSIDDDKNSILFDLAFDFIFDFAKQRFDFSVGKFELQNAKKSNTPFFLLQGSGNNEKISIEEIAFNSLQFKNLTGSSIVDLENNSFSFSLTDSEKEKYLISVIKQEDGYFGVLRGESIALSRYGLEGMTGSFNLTGRADKISDFAFSGNFNASSDSELITANLYINNEIISLTNLEYSDGSMIFKMPSFTLDSVRGKAELESATIEKTLKHQDRDYILSAGLSSAFTFTPNDSLFGLVRNFIKTKGDDISGSVTIDYVNIDNSLTFEDRSFDVVLSDKNLKLDGDFASGFFNFDTKDYDISINAYPIAKFGLSGVLTEESKTIKLHVDQIALSLINLTLQAPILPFTDDSSVHGDIDIVLSDDGLDIYGSLICDYAEFGVWWLPNQKIILHNTPFVIWDNDIKTVQSNATVINTETYEKISAQVNLGLYFNDNFGFDGWDLDVYIDDPDYIYFRLPMVKSNIDMIGRGNGHYRIEFYNGIVHNMGTLTVDDVVVSVGLRELPEWWTPKMKAQSDFDLLLRENCQIVYPLGANPILQATIAENTRIGCTFDDSGFNLTGDISLRSGEIFYFQKYFYITEGTVSFRNGTSGIDPIINLRARLRDFDSNGDSVDIYLVLRESTLSNLSPTFESSPSKDLNEIMSILGQAILPSTAYGDTSIATVVSMAAASVDLLSRVGVINGVDNGLTSTIRNSLSIDTFSLHTNILANLVADTVSLASSSSGGNAFSPMARYLDGTSLYIGKYLRSDIYMQALVHLSANRNNNKKGFTFISDDLLMDTEISLEWTNPMCTVTFFSQPVNLTPYGLLDGFGFTLSKRIVF